MSWVGRFRNLFRRDRLEREIREELESHIEEAIANGRSVEEARRAFGGELLQAERSRDIRLLPWLDSIASDVTFGFRQLKRNRVATITAVISLALATGAMMSAFRLGAAVLWRSLPFADPANLFYIASTAINRDARPDLRDYYDYPTYRQYREIAGERADLMVIGMVGRENLV